MLEKFVHINSKNETLDFVALGIYINVNELRDYEWQVKSSNDKITGFYKGIVKKPIPFVFYVDEKKAAEIKNKFYEHFEVDVLTERAGYFLINGYKYHCFITKSVKSNYLTSKRLLKVEVEITTDKSYWIRETMRTIDFSQVTSEDGLTYPFTYPFTYRNEKTTKVVNENFVESDAIIRMYGPVENPLVKIGDNIYQINISLISTEYLEIDTLERTVYKFDAKGAKTNSFDLRSKEYYAFNKVPSGTLLVSTNGGFKVDIVIIEKRGEPRWT